MQLYVGGLSTDTEENKIAELFSGICPVQSISIIKDIESGRSRGFAIVKILKQEYAEKAIGQLNGVELEGKVLSVRKMPETLPGEMEFREWLVEHALEVLTHVGLTAGQTVMDYGCGSGIFTRAAANVVGKQGKVYAFETRTELLEQIRKMALDEGITNIQAVLSSKSSQKTGLTDNGVDVILIYDVMHEINDPVALLRELGTVLKPDGFLSIFPMHMGTHHMLEIIKESGLFYLRDEFSPAGFKAASWILNFNRY